MAETYLTVIHLSHRYGVHHATIWRWANTQRDFPAPVKLSPGCTRWRLSDIEAWEKARDTVG